MGEEENSPIDQKILDMRLKSNSYLKTIVIEICKYYPFCFEGNGVTACIDPLIALKRVLNVLDEHRLPYSKNEVRTAFNHFWDNQADNKKSYLAWVGKNAVNKVTFKAQLREKNPIPPISKDNHTGETKENHETYSDKGISQDRAISKGSDKRTLSNSKQGEGVK